MDAGREVRCTVRSDMDVTVRVYDFPADTACFSGG
jgi:hypothetical protein